MLPSSPRAVGGGKMDLSSLLEQIKSELVFEDVLPALVNEELLLFLLSWTKIRVTWSPPSVFTEDVEDPYDQWELLWGFSSWDVFDLSMMLGKTETVVLQLFEVAQMYHLIFPDGTIPEFARVAILQFINKKTDGEMSFFLDREEQKSLPPGDTDYEQ